MLSEVREFAEMTIAKYNLDGWTFAWSNRDTRYLGLCNYRKKQIILNKPWVKREGGIASADVKDTILHEIAHAMTPGAGHGKDWKAVCRLIGAIPRATKALPADMAPKYKWEARVGEKVVGKWMKRPHKIERIIRNGTAHVKTIPGDVMLYKIESNKAVLWAKPENNILKVAA